MCGEDLGAVEPLLRPPGGPHRAQLPASSAVFDDRKVASQESVPPGRALLGEAR